MTLENFHRLLDLPRLPDTPAGVVRVAENRRMDVMIDDLLFHIFEIHAPDAIFIMNQRTVDNVVAIVFNDMRKTDIGRAVQEHIVAARTEHIQRTDNTSEHTVFVSDVFFGEIGDAFPGAVPAYDRIVILVGWVEITKRRVFCALDDFLLNGRSRRDIHVCNPHRNRIKTRLWRTGCISCSDGVNRHRVFSMSFKHRSIVELLHIPSLYTRYPANQVWLLYFVQI